MIYYPKIYGTCAGANKAIETAYKLKKENTNKNIYIYKEILHNPYIIKELEKDNIKCIDDLKTLTKDDILIIRAHGEPKETYDYLEENNIEYYDATCTNVLKVHNIAIEKQKNGYKVIIVGKKTHPEVIGTNGWINNEGIIIETKDDYKNLNKNDKYFIVCQTTVSHKKLQELLNYMNENNISYEAENTICNAQKLIQTSSIALAEQMDIMFVIGGKESSNTKELYNLCNEVTKTYYFSNIKDFFNFIKKEKYTFLQKMQVLFLTSIGKYFSVNQICKIFFRLCSKWQSKNTKYYFPINYTYTGNYSRMFDRKIFESTVYGIIRGRKFPVPGGFDQELRQQYGNYQEPPKDNSIYIKHL